MIRLLPYVLLGPISGPLVAGIVCHHREDPVLATLYAAALGFLGYDLPATLSALTHYLSHAR